MKTLLNCVGLDYEASTRARVLELFGTNQVGRPFALAIPRTSRFGTSERLAPYRSETSLQGPCEV